MQDSIEPLELFWDAILSRDPKRILKAFTPLDSSGRQGVIHHLKQMATEEGWHPEQRASALKALDVLKAFI
jgi:hypothetical protein